MPLLSVVFCGDRLKKSEEEMKKYCVSLELAKEMREFGFEQKKTRRNKMRKELPVLKL